jgi:[ribosomal protein S5]-alanine N-acetyltransferase
LLRRSDVQCAESSHPSTTALPLWTTLERAIEFATFRTVRAAECLIKTAPAGEDSFACRRIRGQAGSGSGDNFVQIGKSISTDRLELRPLPAAAVAALRTDREHAAQEIGIQLAPDWPQPALLKILDRHAALTSEELVWGIWMIIDRDEDTVIGDIGFHGPPSDAGVVEVGYCVVPGRRSRGYATEAAKALVDWARQQRQVKSIVAGCDPDNRASIRTLERAGFRQTGSSGEELRWTLAD